MNQAPHKDVPSGGILGSVKNMFTKNQTAEPSPIPDPQPPPAPSAPPEDTPHPPTPPPHPPSPVPSTANPSPTPPNEVPPRKDRKDPGVPPQPAPPPLTPPALHDVHSVSIHPDPLPKDLASLKNMGLNKITAELKKRVTLIVGGASTISDNTPCEVEGVIPEALAEIKMKLDDVRWANNIFLTIQEYPRSFDREKENHEQAIHEAFLSLFVEKDREEVLKAAVKLSSNPTSSQPEVDIISRYIAKSQSLPQDWKPQTKEETQTLIKSFLAGLTTLNHQGASLFDRYFWATIAHEMALEDLPKRKELGKASYDEAMKYQQEALEVLAKNKERALNEKYASLKDVEEFIRSTFQPNPVTIGECLEKSDEAGLKKALSPLQNIPENFSADFPIFATAIQWNSLNHDIPLDQTPPSLNIYIKITRILSGDEKVEVSGYNETTTDSQE